MLGTVGERDSLGGGGRGSRVYRISGLPWLSITSGNGLPGDKEEEMRLIGDSKNCDGTLYEKKMTIEDCQVMVDLLCDVLNIPPIKVIKGRESKRRHGYLFQEKRLMSLNKPSEGIVIHELAHIFRLGHGPIYKKYQDKIQKLWIAQ